MKAIILDNKLDPYARPSGKPLFPSSSKHQSNRNRFMKTMIHELFIEFEESRDDNENYATHDYKSQKDTCLLINSTTAKKLDPADVHKIMSVD